MCGVCDTGISLTPTNLRTFLIKKASDGNFFHRRRFGAVPLRLITHHHEMVQEKSPCPERARTLLRGTTLHLYSAKGSTGNQKAPVHSGTGARSRYHPALYFNGYSVTGTSVRAYYLRPGSSRVIDHGYVAPVFTIHRLSEAPNFRFPLVHSMYLFELDCKYNGYTQVCQMEIF